MKTAIVIPTRNAGPYLDELLPALSTQSLGPHELLVIDSSSSDGTPERLRAFGARVHSIDVDKFNHGGTRRLATGLVAADLYVFLTQDAIPTEPNSVATLVAAVAKGDDVGMAYGRQLARRDATPIATHARLFNYPERSEARQLSDAMRLGVKTCFCSNSFAAYRATALADVGGFPECVIGTEDTYVAARMLKKGWAVRYESGARVAHSHNYTLLEEFRRYFDIGVFYGREAWIGETFGKWGQDGWRYVRSELTYLRRSGHGGSVPEALIRNAFKLTAYRLGHVESYLPTAVKRRISMFPRFWVQQSGA